MNIKFDLIALLVVGCSFFTTFFVAPVTSTMEVIITWGISIVTRPWLAVLMIASLLFLMPNP
ncbi:hypothetical protein ACO0S5_13630, partial [Klebsiella pneumoniae]